jgi:hypothetical protein
MGSPIVKRDGNVLFEELAGGGALARPSGCIEPCECFPGKIYFDFKTNAKVGYQRFFYDPDEGVYFLDGKRLSNADAAKVDRKSTPEYWLDPRYVGEDGLIRGAGTGYEWCDVCERQKRAKLGHVTFSYWITTPSLKRTYWFEFGRSAPPELEIRFVRCRELLRPHTAREQTEFIIWCLLCFPKYSSVRDSSKRALAKRFRISRGRIRSIRLRCLRRLMKSAVPLKP